MESESTQSELIGEESTPPSAEAYDLPPVRVGRSLALRIAALVTLVLLASGLLALSVVGEMRSLRARFDLLTGVYVPFQERLSAAHVQSAKIAAAVSTVSGDGGLSAADRLNLLEALRTREGLVQRSRHPLDQGLAHADRIGGDEPLENLRRLSEQVRELEALVEVGEDEAVETLADPRRQDQVARAFRGLEDAARRGVRAQRDAVGAAAQKAEQITLLSMIGLGVAALLATLAVIVTLRPLRRLPGLVRRLSRGEWGERLDVHLRPERDDEVARLAREFNHMSSALEERERRLIRGERLAAIGQMAAQITHEIRNPLSSVALSAELLEDELPGDADEARRLLSRISGEVDRLTEITETYLRFSRRPKPDRQPIDLAAVLHELLEFLADRHAALDVDVVADVAEETWVRGDARQLRQALMNLLRNAAEAAREGADARAEAGAQSAASEDPLEGAGRGRIEVRSGCKDGEVWVVVQDDGPGIGLPPEAHERIFEAFFTNKAQGTGLGLPMVQQILSDHDGSVSVASSGPSGTAFELRLPACDRPGPSVSSRDAAGAPGSLNLDEGP